MKFGKLLAAGKSWVGYPETGRYQMRQGMNLPQFISPKNPFKQEAAAQPSAPPVVAAAPAMTVPATPVASAAPVEVPVSRVAPVAAAQATLPVAKVSWRGRVSEAAKMAGKFIRSAGAGVKRAVFFCLDHNPFSAIGRPKLAGIPRFGKPAVQAELSLDRVRVVRNDLTHADLEVVRAGGGSK